MRLACFDVSRRRAAPNESLPVRQLPRREQVRARRPACGDPPHLLGRRILWPTAFGYHRRVTADLFVPVDFAVPDGLIAADFRLAPLGPQHNEADHAAWMNSIDHIRATPGFAGSSWPHEMSPEENLRDLERHARDFAGRRGFTYTVLSAGTDEVIGCVYIYPPGGEGPGGGTAGRLHATVRSWVRADRAALDTAVHDAVIAWLERDWPFHAIEYAART